MPLLELKQQLIDKIKRYNKAVAYMDSAATDADKDKWVPELRKLMDEICDIESQLRAQGCVMPDEEIRQLVDNLRGS